MVGAAGLFVSGSLIGSVIGTQLERQVAEPQPSKVHSRPAERRSLPDKGLWQRNGSSHALTVFMNSTGSGREPAPGSLTIKPPHQQSEELAPPVPDSPAAPQSSEMPAEVTPAEPEVAMITPPALPRGEEGLPQGEQAPWRRFAAATEEPGDRPAIAIVIDDLGLNLPNTRKAIKLPPPVSLAFMTYGHDLARMARIARSAGHELLVHVPMEPVDAEADPGPNVLSTTLDDAELQRRIEWGLSRFEGFVGINNHMGSRFTASEAGMARVMRSLKAKGLLFLDSQTVAHSAGVTMAERAGVPLAVRDIFLDNNPEPEDIRRQLRKLERLAMRRGFAVGIGHPHSSTLEALEKWIPEMKSQGFVFVPTSYIAKRRQADG